MRRAAARQLISHRAAITGGGENFQPCCRRCALDLHSLGGKPRAQLRLYASRTAGCEIERTPKSACLRQQLAVGRTQHLRMSLECQPTGFAYPRPQQDCVVLHRSCLVINLVSQNDPDGCCLLLRGSNRSPVSRCYILNPAQVDGVIHVAELVDVLRRNVNPQLKSSRRRSRRHTSRMARIRGRCEPKMCDFLNAFKAVSRLTFDAPAAAA